MIRAGLVQLNASDDPARNLPETLRLIRQAHAEGATFVLTPEVSNCVSANRQRQQEVLQTEPDDDTLRALRALASELKIWLLIGSLALKSDDPDGRFVNRSFLVDPDGSIRARYDKIHMFDVALSDTESYRESAGYRPGRNAVVARAPVGAIGMTICYDLRFPQLYRKLAQAGAWILTVPSAFSPTSGAAHWHALLRARAIENGAFVLAPAQVGDHAASAGRPRRTFGHSLAVSPWGEVLAEIEGGPGVCVVDIDPLLVEDARRRIPSLRHDREIRIVSP